MDLLPVTVSVRVRVRERSLEICGEGFFTIRTVFVLRVCLMVCVVYSLFELGIASIGFAVEYSSRVFHRDAIKQKYKFSLTTEYRVTQFPEENIIVPGYQVRPQAIPGMVTTPLLTGTPSQVVPGEVPVSLPTGILRQALL